MPSDIDEKGWPALYVLKCSMKFLLGPAGPEEGTTLTTVQLVRFCKVVLAGLACDAVFHHLANTWSGSRLAAMLVVTVYAKFFIYFNVNLT